MDSLYCTSKPSYGEMRSFCLAYPFVRIEEHFSCRGIASTDNVAVLIRGDLFWIDCQCGGSTQGATRCFVCGKGVMHIFDAASVISSEEQVIMHATMCGYAFGMQDIGSTITEYCPHEEVPLCLACFSPCSDTEIV